MSDMAYIMETQDPRELWLVEGENKFKVSRDMYWLLASNGADLPQTHHITELVTENAKLREEVERLRSVVSDGADNAREVLAENAKFIVKLNAEHIARQNVEVENAKLRELASILCFCMQVHAQCDDCKLNGAKGEIAHDPLCACDGLHEILRELEIEV